MQKVVGSNPITRSTKAKQRARLLRLLYVQTPHLEAADSWVAQPSLVHPADGRLCLLCYDQISVEE